MFKPVQPCFTMSPKNKSYEDLATLTPPTLPRAFHLYLAPVKISLAPSPGTKTRGHLSQHCLAHQTPEMWNTDYLISKQFLPSFHNYDIFKPTSHQDCKESGEGQGFTSTVNISNLLLYLWDLYLIKTWKTVDHPSRSTLNHTPRPLTPSFGLPSQYIDRERNPTRILTSHHSSDLILF